MSTILGDSGKSGQGGRDKANKKSVVNCQEVTEMQTMLNEVSSGDQKNSRVSMAGVSKTGGLDAQNKTIRANIQDRLN